MDTISAAAAASPGMSSGFFLDPNGRLTKDLLDWLLCSVEKLHRKGKPIRPLFINGQVKTGKSYMLNEVLPAVVNTYCSGSSGQKHVGVVLPEPNFLRVTCLTCDRNNGNGGFLRSFLIRLKRSAAKQQLFAAASTPIPSDCDAESMLGAIQDFMQCLPQDRLNFLLIDEVQSFFLMRRPMSDNSQQRSSTLAVDLLLQMRCILKELLLESPYWVAWAITGSSMATLWANVAATPGWQSMSKKPRTEQTSDKPSGTKCRYCHGFKKPGQSWQDHVADCTKAIKAEAEKKLALAAKLESKMQE
ncbi:hypothetical protein Vafri_1343 [Volvox africanus]|nr:hypothetical protein Vafri_1343 [Volvox africanus]